MKKHRFKKGDKVSYSLGGKILFKGVISGIETDPTKKPYIITTDDGHTMYANASYLIKKN